jgi:hypothetical protein
LIIRYIVNNKDYNIVLDKNNNIKNITNENILNKNIINNENLTTINETN